MILKTTAETAAAGQRSKLELELGDRVAGVSYAHLSSASLVIAILWHMTAASDKTFRLNEFSLYNYPNVND